MAQAGNATIVSGKRDDTDHKPGSQSIEQLEYRRFHFNARRKAQIWSLRCIVIISDKQIAEVARALRLLAHNNHGG